MAKVEGAEQPLAESVNEGISEAGKEVVVSDGEESRQWAELKWSRRADESGAVKSQCRQRQHAWTRLRREERAVSELYLVEWRRRETEIADLHAASQRREVPCLLGEVQLYANTAATFVSRQGRQRCKVN